MEFYQREICNLNSNEGDICMEILNAALKDTGLIFKNGIFCHDYINTDQVICDKRMAKMLVKLLVLKIQMLQEYLKEKHPKKVFNKIGLIRQDTYGSIGLISLMGALIAELDFPIIIVQNERMLVRGYIKGDLQKDDKILLLGDVVETGWTIYDAAEKIWNSFSLFSEQPKVYHALAIIDKGRTATVNLGRKGIELVSFFNLETFQKKKASEFREIYGKNVFPSNPPLIDFGGRSITMIL